MQMACGLLCPDQGQILCFGADPYMNRSEVSKKLGYMPEIPPLYSNMRTKDFLNFFIDLHEAHKSRLEELIHICHLEPILNKVIGQLSKGNKQKVGLAQCLVHDPDLLILDEPTAGLDPVSVIEVRNLVHALSKRNKSILISTHILSEAQNLCDSMTVLTQGAVVASGTLEVLQTNYLGKISLSLLFEQKQWPLLQRVIFENGFKIEKEETGKVQLLIANESYIPIMIEQCVNNKILLYEVRREQQNVEQLFVQLTRSSDESSSLTH
jgi:ABC-2 type transport system ATP-binding protein